MQKMNKQMNLPAMQKIMMEFQKQEIAEMTGEMIGESMDDMMEEEDEERPTSSSLRCWTRLV